MTMDDFLGGGTGRREEQATQAPAAGAAAAQYRAAFGELAFQPQVHG